MTVNPFANFAASPLATTFDINLALVNAPLLQTQEFAIDFARGPRRPPGGAAFGEGLERQLGRRIGRSALVLPLECEHEIAG